jgi:tape measure domain-containing protein
VAQVQLDLALGLEAFQAKVAAAEGMLLRLKSKTDAGLSLKAYLDTSSLDDQLKAAQKVLSQGSTQIKVATDFYKTGSQYAISATKLKTQIIDPIQQKVAADRKYTIKIGTELTFDQNSLKQIDAIVAKAKASLESVQRSTAATRQQLGQLTQAPGQGGLDAAGLRRLQSAAGQAGIKTSASGATELRKELRTAFAKASDDAINGLAQGLVAKSSTVVDASTKTGQALIKALKKSLGIASPSKETGKLGQASADGFGGGFVKGMTSWERQMAAAIRQAIGSAFQQGLSRDAAARGALADMGRDAGQLISSSLGKALKQGLASSVAPALKGGLLGATGGLATGGAIGGAGALKGVAAAGLTKLGAGGLAGMAGKLSHLGAGDTSGLTGFLQDALGQVVQAAGSTGGHGALLGAAGVAGVAGLGGLAKGAGGSLVSQAVESIKNRILGTAVQQAQAQSQTGGSTAGAISAPIENAGNIFSALKSATGTVAKGLLGFAKELTPGALQQRIVDIAWSIDQAAEQFGVLKKDTQVLAGKVRNTWNAFSNNTPAHLLPPQPVAGTGLVRQQNLQLGDVTGRTAVDFPTRGYGRDGGFVGPAESGDLSRGFINQTRKTLQPTMGKPGEWRIVSEVNGVWQRIKTDSEMAAERMAQIRSAITSSQSFTNVVGPRNTRGTGLDGKPLLSNGQAVTSQFNSYTGNVGTFNPFDKAFYRPTQPPQAPPPGGGGSFGGNRFGTPSPGGALAMRNEPVEMFTSFKEAERLLALVEQRLSAVAKAFDTLKVKSQIQVDQEVRKLAVSLRAVELAFQKGEISANDLRAASYGAARELAGLGAKSAEVQNLAQAFESLGIQSRAAVDALQDQRNLDLGFIEGTLGKGSSEATRARNARDIQQLGRANELVRTAQGASGFGGFRGREIGNDELNKAQQRSTLANAVREMQEYQGTLKLTETNAKTYARVQAALTEEISSAERAFAVLNGTAKQGETITHLARNAWGTILDDFKNLVPQLLVFAVAYNLILQRVLTTPGAVIQAAAAFDRLETSISAYLSATRGIGDASGVIAELRDVALDLGIGFEKAASSYLRFAAATQGTALEGQEVDITRTLATAGRNQGLGGEQIDRASVALTQILSKGRVQSEELRGQLAEQLPGALQVAARAFGVTTKELYRMVEAGQIAGDEFVGRFMRQLRAEGASTNQLAGSFSNVSEQLGSSIQTMAAAAGQPFLAPLTLGLQGVNAVIQALIPAAPVVTGLFVVLGAQALRGALGVKSLSGELLGMVRNLFTARDAAEGYSAGLVKLTGIARVAGTVLATVGKAALIGLAFEAVAGTIRYLKGEVGALGDELKKVNKIAEGGEGGGLNGLQKFFGSLNVAQNISDRTTFFDAAKIGQSTDQVTGKILGNQKKIAESIRQVNRIDRQLYEERIRRDQAEANKDEQGAKRSIERIKELEKQRGQVKFEVSPEDAQVQLGAMKAAEQATQKLIERQKALGNNSFVEEQQLERLRKTREEFEKTAKAAGLLDQSLLKVQSLGALQSRLKANEEILPALDVNSASYRNQQLTVAGLRQGITDQQLLPQERALKTQETVLRRMSTELKVQENIQRIKLGLVDNERKALEASLSLERTRGQLREAVAQRRVEVAGALSAPEEQLAAEVQLRRVREGSQAKELQMQGQLLGKDRERVGIETSLQKEQIKLQTQQLAIDKQMLSIERLKMEAAAKQGGISADLRRNYFLQLGQIDKTIAATNTLIGQEGALLQSVEAKGAAELSALGIKQQELDVQLQILGANSLTAQQVEQIKAAKQDIANKEAAALASVQAATAALERQQQAIENQLDAVRATVEAQRERARLAEENARTEMGLVDRLLELQQGRNDGGFFERLAKASLLGASGEQQAYDLASRRMDLQRQIQEQQLRQKRLELDLKKQELAAEKALNDLKLKGLRIANEEAKIKLRSQLEEARLTLEQLGGNRSAAQNQLLQQVGGTLAGLGGYNPQVQGNSQNVNLGSLINQGQSLQAQDRLLGEMEAAQGQVYSERAAALDNLIASEERMLGIQQRLFDLDAAQWFGQFLDKSTQVGRTLGVITDGLSEFRTTVSQAFSDAITNGADVQDAIADAGQAMAGKIVTGLFDEMVLKPMEANLFKGLAQVFGFEQPQSDQAATASNTAQTKQSVDAVNTSVQALQGAIREGSAAVVAAIGGIAQPTLATPTYRAPENAGMTGAVPGMAGGQRAFFGATGNVNNGDPNWVHGHLQSVVGSASQTVEDGLLLVRELMNKGVPVEVGSGVTRALSAAMNDDQIRGALRQAIAQHTHSGGGTALDVWVPKGTEVPLPMSDVRNTPGAREGINGLLPSGKTFMGHLDPKTVGAGALPTGAPPAPVLPPATMSPLTGTTGNPVRVTVVPFGGATATLDQAGAMVSGSIPQLSTDATSAIGKLGAEATQATATLAGVSEAVAPVTQAVPALGDSIQGASAAISGAGNAAQTTPAMFGQLNTAMGAAVQALAGIGMIGGGVGMMSGGGTYNTLMGLAGIFGGISSVAGMFTPGGALGGLFGKGGAAGGSIAPGPVAQSAGVSYSPGYYGPAFKATGGPVRARKPYIVGEKGMELFIPSSDGAIVPNNKLYAANAAALQGGRALEGEGIDGTLAGAGAGLFSQNQAAMVGVARAQQQQQQDLALERAAALPARMEFNYQSQVINNVEYVTAEQFRRGMTDAAERGRSLTMSSLQNSVKARKRIGI